MINKAVLIGRLTRDVEIRYTGSGTAVGQFTLAVNRPFKNQQGEREADFINCVIWRKTAENLANFTHKGSLIGIDGRIQTRNYDNKDGQRVYVTEVVVDDFSLLESRNQDQSNSQSGYGNTTQQNSNANGYSNQHSSANPQSNPSFTANDSQLDITDDDLPF